MGTAAERRTTHLNRGTARGQRTRQTILDAARRAFERDGYIDVNIDDIVAEAGLARGSFYTYFPSKLEIFRVLSEEITTAVDDAVASRSDETALDVVARLKRSNDRYIEAYERNAAMYGLLEQVATIDDQIHLHRLERRRSHVTRIAGRITSWQQRDLADPKLDPIATSSALISMTSNSCYWWFVGDEVYNGAESRQSLNDIWVRALSLRSLPKRRRSSPDRPPSV